jgi:hypothetical protein
MSKGTADESPVVAGKRVCTAPICMKPMGAQLLKHLASLDPDDIEQEAVSLALLLLEAREQARTLVQLRQQSSRLMEGMGGRSKLSNFHDEQ